MADSMIQNLLKTPSQIREEQLQKMRQEAAGRAQLGGVMRGASSALPGIFSSVLQQQRPALATDIAQTARGLTQGLGGMLSAAGAPQAGQALAQATVTPEERQAAQTQSVMRGLDMNDPAALLKAAQQLQTQGLTGAATALVQKASVLKQSAAELARTQQQTQTEVTKQAKNLADMNLTEEEIATEIAKRNPTIDQITVETAASQALADKRRVEADRISQLLPGELAQQTANLTETEVKTDELNSQIALNRRRLAELGQTEFLRELEASNLTEEQKKTLIDERVQTRARTGGVSGVGNKIIDLRLDSISGIIDTGRTADTGLRVAEQAIQILPDANVGYFSGPAAYANRIMAALGISDDAQRATVANQLVEVLTGQLTLDRASALKGALSDKDLAFLLQSGPRADLNVQTLQQMFTDLYQERYAEKRTAEWFDAKLGDTTDSEIKSMKVEELRNKRMELYRLEAKADLARRFGSPTGN